MRGWWGCSWWWFYYLIVTLGKGDSLILLLNCDKDVTLPLRYNFNFKLYQVKAN